MHEICRFRAGFAGLRFRNLRNFEAASSGLRSRTEARLLMSFAGLQV